MSYTCRMIIVYYGAVYFKIYSSSNGNQLEITGYNSCQNTLYVVNESQESVWLYLLLY